MGRPCSSTSVQGGTKSTWRKKVSVPYRRRRRLPRRAGPPGAALVGLNMLVETLGGRSYTESEHQAALAAAGFVDVRAVPLEVIPAYLALGGRRP